MLAFETRAFLVAEEAPQAHEIGRDDGETHHARKSIGPEGSDPLQAVVLEPVDRRFNGRMLLPGGGEFGGLFAFALGVIPLWLGLDPA